LRVNVDKHDLYGWLTYTLTTKVRTCSNFQLRGFRTSASDPEIWYV